uniref:NADH-ubiquinone oxidoreductase chain 2 n=1 Tax=Acropoma japonicum TaxID=223805 RepID=A0A1V1G2N5_ACRJP|nr:NADH dehydrogenase subunit 2 [Synagrops japonicus]WNH22064.1 NADH dehydrogenase subunit 2 [Synagrops bellus]BAX03722.1 NADH dehydrogenase subunit 2 [Synagrops japonicus]BBU25814.1 NADH dehydrogenase subunit 2 [Synagrops japonicus]
MHPTLFLLFATGLALGTITAFSSSHWFLAWMGLEIGTLAILPLMAQRHHPRGVEAATKYFIVQAIGAAAILFATITNGWDMGFWNLDHLTDPLASAIFTLGIALKMGLAPLHTWVPEVLQGLDLTTGLILSTWQKLAPFALLLQLPSFDPFIMLPLCLLSALVGGWGGMNQTQLRKVLAYSSIAHLGWITLVLQYSTSFALLALLTYFATTFATFLTFKLNDSTTINQLSYSWAKTPVLTSCLPLIMFSLAGLPPLFGFTPKWLILQTLVNHDFSLVATLMALTALLSLFFYMRLAFAMTLTMSHNDTLGVSPWRLSPTQDMLILATTITISLLSLPLTPVIVFLLSR